MAEYGIKAVFCNKQGQEAGATFYSEVTFRSEQKALKAINGGLGEQLSQASIIDSENEADLEGLTFSDLEPYLINKGEECQR